MYSTTPYYIYLNRTKGLDDNQYLSIDKWCEENFGLSGAILYNSRSRWYSKPEPSGYTFVFRYRNDFMQFKLAWCCDARD